MEGDRYSGLGLGVVGYSFFFLPFSSSLFFQFLNYIVNLVKMTSDCSDPPSIENQIRGRQDEIFHIWLLWLEGDSG
jgi:hypothetical protein